MFGSGFGAQRPSGSQPSFGFGQTQPQTAQTSLFGQPAPQVPQAGSAFGAPASGPSPGLFGSSAATQTPSPFGATAGASMGIAGSQQQQQQQQQGTAKAPFVATELPDPAKGLSKTDRYQTITMMPAYENMSVQELRWQDYQANRKGPNSTAGATSGFGFGAQPQQSGSMFGQQQASASPFGSSPSNSAFGGSNTNTSSGLFGRSNSTTGSSSLFGSNNTSNTGSAFGGGANTNTGSGLFGQNNSNSSAFGQPASTNTSTGFGFGSNQNPTNSTGGLFGQQSQPASTGLFGASQPVNNSPFGQNNSSSTQSTGFGFGQPQGQSQSAFGSGGGLFGQNSNSSTNSNTGTNAFGQSSSSPFGSTTSNTSGGLFGQNQNQNQSQTQNQNQNQGGGLFGANSTNNSGTGFGFGAQSSGGNLFGQNNNSNNSAPTSGLFGQSNTQNSGGLFGGSTGNTLGQQPGSGFGFNTSQSKPATGFGSTSGTSFGQPSTGGGGFANAAGTSSGLFGQGASNSNQQQQTAPTGFGFGQNSTTNNASTNTGSSLFGQSQQPKTGFGFGQPTGTNNSTGGSLFGGNKPPGGGLFGSSTPGTGSSGSLFGNNAAGNNSTATSGGGSLFGNSNNTNNATPGFGSANNNGGGGSLFGGGGTANSGTGLFGNKPAAGGGLFGNTASNNTSGGASKPTFGSTAPAGGSLFGGTNGFGNPQTQQSQPSGGLFGSANKPAGGLFGNNNAANTSGSSMSFGNASSTAAAPSFAQGSGGSLFAQQQATGPVASIGSNAYGSNPLFTNVQQPATTSAQNDQPRAVPRKDDATFKPPTGVLLAHIMQPHQLLVTAKRLGKGRNVKDAEESRTLDEFSKMPPWPASANTDSSVQESEEREKLGGATGFASVRFRNVLFSNNTDDIILNSDAFELTRRRALPSTKSAIEIDESPRAVSVSTPTKGAITKDSHADDSEIGLDSEGPLSEPTREGSNSPSVLLSSPRGEEPGNISESDASAVRLSAEPDSDTPDNEIVNEEGYWISPAQRRLTNMTLREIRNTKDFRVGQRTHGFVEFLEPVDLSAFSDVQAQVCGRIVVISDRSFCLYPIESERPPVGQGFNVKHRVTLYNVFARARDTQEPIKNPEHPICKKFAKRLQTKGSFVSWSAQTGTWTFEIDPAKDN